MPTISSWKADKPAIRGFKRIVRILVRDQAFFGSGPNGACDGRSPAAAYSRRTYTTGPTTYPV